MEITFSDEYLVSNDYEKEIEKGKIFPFFNYARNKNCYKMFLVYYIIISPRNAVHKKIISYRHQLGDDKTERNTYISIAYAPTFSNSLFSFIPELCPSPRLPRSRQPTCLYGCICPNPNNHPRDNCP
jgi:hypothetical protein